MEIPFGLRRLDIPVGVAVVLFVLLEACTSSGGGGTGTSGTTGHGGTTGSAGVTGSAGTTGTAGTTGAAGTIGSPTGNGGTTGSAGTTGGAGTTGSAGSTGTGGVSGAGGAAGISGSGGARAGAGGAQAGIGGGNNDGGSDDVMVHDGSVGGPRRIRPRRLRPYELDRNLHVRDADDECLSLPEERGFGRRHPVIRSRRKIQYTVVNGRKGNRSADHERVAGLLHRRHEGDPERQQGPHAARVQGRFRCPWNPRSLLICGRHEFWIAARY